VEPRPGDSRPHVPPPSLWPVGFAVGIVCILAGLIVSWPAVAAGAVIAAVFGFLWVRDVTSRSPAPAPAAEAETGPGGPETSTAAAPIPANEGEAALPQMDEAEIDRYPRNVFLSGATLGLGAVIGGLVTVPALGFMIAPAFTSQHEPDADIGPLKNFPEGEWRVVTFSLVPGEQVSRRTAFVRNNGLLNGKPSFTVISNHCAHLGCPVQPGGITNFKQRVFIDQGGPKEVDITPTKPANFGCPCHGGSYDTEGNRIAGPPVRALDRYEFLIKNGHLVLGKPYSVAKVKGSGKNALIKRYTWSGPGEHLDGIESWLYPIQPPGH
jgi:quinol---cytochrome c reductase iron-sulfur subunit, bacillus type